MLRGFHDKRGKEYILGTVENVVENGVENGVKNVIFTDAKTNVQKTLLANKWYKFTYVLNIGSSSGTYDLYIDEVKVTKESQKYSYFRGFQKGDFFRIRAANTSAPDAGAEFMIDDIKVYGCTTNPNPTAKTTE